MNQVTQLLNQLIWYDVSKFKFMVANFFNIDNQNFMWWLN